MDFLLNDIQTLSLNKEDTNGSFRRKKELVRNKISSSKKYLSDSNWHLQDRLMLINEKLNSLSHEKSSHFLRSRLKKFSIAFITRETGKIFSEVVNGRMFLNNDNKKSMSRSISKTKISCYTKTAII